MTSKYVIYISVTLLCVCSMVRNGLADDSFRLEEAGVSEVNAAFASGVLNSEKLVQLYLNRIEAYDHQGPSLNSIISINPNAIETARALDEERRISGPRSPLHGIPILLKDNYDTFDLPTTAGSLSLEGSIPPDDAFITQRLRESGAILLGKTNLQEFAAGPNAFSSLGGLTLNPYDTSRIPGGSSGGTGAAIAANFATIGLGTDTAGSVRIPASMNGLVGLKPTMGLTSRDGIIPFNLERDIGGPMARTVTDVAFMLDIISGQDAADPVTQRSVGQIPNSYLDALEVDGLNGARIGVVREFIDKPSADQNILSIVNQSIEDITRLGATLIDVSLGGLPDFGSSSYISFRYDMNNYLESLGEDAPVRTVDELIQSGNYEPSLNFFPFSFLRPDIPPEDDASHAAVQRISERVASQVLEVMQDLNLDALIYPTVTQKTPPARNSLRLELIENTNFSSLIGFPSISVPGGFTPDGLPLGIEFLARPFDESRLLSFAFAYEQGTRHRQPPNTTPALPGETLFLGDFDHSGTVDVIDIDLLAFEIRSGSADPTFDIDGSNEVDESDLMFLVTNVLQTWLGDSNLDGEFNSGDLVEVFQAGRYEAGSAANWSQGDWNGDGVFDSGDFVTGFQGGGYEQGPRGAARAVPEPTGFLGLIAVLTGVAIHRRR